MMTPARFKAARAAVIEASKWNDSRIRGEMAECIEISNTTEVHVAVPVVVRERAEAIAVAQTPEPPAPKRRRKATR